ncbi:MAG: bis(5'-nucleosyl)-tetraphosphatase (symmetrical) YqeK [Candidatus Sumerlaeota bacterium]|nr:bis(5'-nucleosyl)-tetraphosphatase (symmetrical) YqeK [Candidatus Sumerlaeota bacterium]
MLAPLYLAAGANRRQLPFARRRHHSEQRRNPIPHGQKIPVTPFDIDRLIERLERRLDRNRFYHTLGTAQTAITLALRFGASANNALLAGLLHDCARCFSRKEQWGKIEEWGVPVPPDAGDYPPLWHTWMSAEAARRCYGFPLDDPEIEQAIIYHATGKPAMDRLGEIIYVADCIEPARDYAEVEQLRAVARQDLREAVRQCLEMKINHVRAKGRRLHPDTLAALNYYSRK